MNYHDAALHVRGESIYIDDHMLPAGCLHAAVYASPLAHGLLKKIDLTAAQQAEGVAAVYSARDIPGENQIGGIIPDEVLLADQKIEFIGQPLAIVLAATPEAARRAARLITAEIKVKRPLLDARQAFARNQLIQPPRVFACGDVDAAWARCDHIVSGRAESGGQEHLYLETQGALALPREDGGIKLFSATQSPTTVQKTVARVLGLPMHHVEVEVLRLGGAFGGKEDQASCWAALAALAAYKIRKPVKLVLRRQEDMRYTGKRHPYSSDFKIGLTRHGVILAYEVTFYQNAGAAADLSPAILDRTLFHTTNCYAIPNVRATGYSCRTNLPPNTAFRGFGGPQAMFVIESAIHKAAEAIGVDAALIQQTNLLRDGDAFPYGQKALNPQVRRCWQRMEQLYEVEKRREEIAHFNACHAHEKKGLAVMPLCFGISFTNTMLNQANALVHVYMDGSVGISTGVVEMGQGTHEKIRRIAARVLGISPARIRMESTNTTRNANTSATAASTGPDLNGNATRIACENILLRLKSFVAVLRGIDAPDCVTITAERVLIEGAESGYAWPQLIREAYAGRINLSAHAHYATPRIFFDREKNRGDAFAYHVYGAGVVEATVDTLRGTCRFDAVRLVHDAGQSLDPLIDQGQAEGAVVQGLGWLTLEEVVHHTDGRLLADSLSTYKVPDILFAPAVIEVDFLPDSLNPPGPFHSKAIGEPPFMYGIAGFFALLNAMKAFRPRRRFDYAAPLTPERILMGLHGK